MVQPIQYQIPGALNPFENLVSGLKLGATMADMDTARAQQQAATQLAQQKALAEQAKIAQQQKMQETLAEFSSKPNKTFDDYQKLSLFLEPQAAKNLMDSFAVKSKSEQDREKLKVAQYTHALEVNPTTAIAMMNKEADDFEAAGEKVKASLLRDGAKMAEVNPKNVKDVLLTTYGPVFGKEWTDATIAATQAPYAARTAVAGARKAEAEAGVAEGTQQARIDEAIAKARAAEIEIKTLEAKRDAELSTAQSDANRAAINAKYADQIAKADLKVKNAQAFASGASAKSSLAAAKKSEFEMKQGPSPLIATIQDPKNPTETITIDVRRYTPGTSIGSAGVIGSSGKSAVYAQKEAKAEEGKTLVADIIDSLKANYQTLNTARAIPSSQRGVLSNLLTAVEVSGPGQFASRITGSDVQPIRDVIQSSRLQLLNAIKQATGLSSQQLNSNVELQTWLKSVSDPTQQIEAVIPILENIEKFAGGGGKKIDSSKVNAEGGVDMNNPLLKK